VSYSETVMQHFQSPRRVGDVAAPDGAYRGENPVCGDVCEFSLRLADGMVAEVRFRVLGCVAAIASASCLGDLVEGVPVEQALQVDSDRLLSALGGLPASKKHGASLAVDVFRRALQNALDSSNHGR
jgi:nitrogen fixation NifU-like protein